MILPLSNGLLIYNAIRRSDPRVTLHIVRRDSTVSKSFAPLGTTIESCDECRMRTILKGSSAGNLWVTHHTRYQLDRWTAEGTLQKSLVRSVPWYQPRDWGLPQRQPDMSPEVHRKLTTDAMIKANVLTRDAAVDKSGRIWYSFFAVNHPLKSGYHVEIIHGNTGELIAAARLPTIPPTWIDGTYAYLSGERPDGSTYLNIVRPVLR